MKRTDTNYQNTQWDNQTSSGSGAAWLRQGSNVSYTFMTTWPEEDEGEQGSMYETDPTTSPFPVSYTHLTLPTSDLV